MDLASLKTFAALFIQKILNEFTSFNIFYFIYIIFKAKKQSQKKTIISHKRRK